jgi:hypothetical protein
MVEKLDPDFTDPVEGPKLVDTEEQARTRSKHAADEREEDRIVRSDKTSSTLEQNLGGAGVDDRGVEDRDR